MAAKKELKPGVPIEIVRKATEIIDALHALYADQGAHLANRVFFSSHDDNDQEHLIIIDFDQDRGDGEYILVTIP